MHSLWNMTSIHFKWRLDECRSCNKKKSFELKILGHTVMCCNIEGVVPTTVM